MAQRATAYYVTIKYAHAPKAHGLRRPSERRLKSAARSADCDWEPEQLLKQSRGVTRLFTIPHHHNYTLQLASEALAARRLIGDCYLIGNRQV